MVARDAEDGFPGNGLEGNIFPLLLVPCFVKNYGTRLVKKLAAEVLKSAVEGSSTVR
jgi:hypothetical protein